MIKEKMITGMRAKVSREDLAEAMQKIVMDIEYSNFKDSVAKNRVINGQVFMGKYGVLY
ncbi:MAG: hypothetical protein KKF00_03855 [Proteobacteria bacterium]|nr:hypothetical protein [Pseudomonadota bacterium]